MSTEKEDRNTERNEKRNSQKRLKVKLRGSDGMLQSE